MLPIRIGTRKSKLALWQAEYVAGLLQQCGFPTELVPIETKGDRVLDVSIAKIGSKGVFTEEIEAALASGELDIAVHSAKDMQSILPEGFELIAFTKREYPGDVLVSRNPEARLSLPLRIGTSSVRRVALLKHRYPHMHLVDMRGNLQTRIRKMDEGVCDALILAFAGTHRMAYDELIREKLSLDFFVPAVGQGAIAIEACTRLSPELKEKIRIAANHEDTECCLLAERAYLRKLEGGCSIPAFGLATLKNTGELSMMAGIVAPEGEQLITKKLSAPRDRAEAMGMQLGEEILEMGGAKILAAIKKERQEIP